MEYCTKCNGTGFEEFFEEGSYYKDACYHCANTGKVNSDIAYRDKLMKVASKLAHNHVCEMKAYRDSNPDGEDWNFCAAENMMSSRDYFDMHVYDYTIIFTDKLNKLDQSAQQLLIAWNDNNAI